jgi:hypothetical protein
MRVLRNANVFLPNEKESSNMTQNNRARALTLWGMIAILYGVLVLSQAKSAIHEIEAGVAFVIATLSLGFAGVMSIMIETDDDVARLVKKFDVLMAQTPAPLVDHADEDF